MSVALFTFSFPPFGFVGSLLLARGFSLVAASGGCCSLRRVGATLHCGARASHCSGFSCCRARALGARASVVAVRGLSSCGSRALERRLSSCGAQIEPVSPALAGRFSTTVPPGKSPTGLSNRKAVFLSMCHRCLWTFSYLQFGATV